MHCFILKNTMRRQWQSQTDYLDGISIPLLLQWLLQWTLKWLNCSDDNTRVELFSGKFSRFKTASLCHTFRIQPEDQVKSSDAHKLVLPKVDRSDWVKKLTKLAAETTIWLCAITSKQVHSFDGNLKQFNHVLPVFLCFPQKSREITLRLAGQWFCPKVMIKASE